MLDKTVKHMAFVVYLSSNILLVIAKKQILKKLDSWQIG